VFYLIKEKGVADAAQAAVRVSGLELGGLLGSLIAGRLSDYMINNSGGKGGAVGKRVQVGCSGDVWYQPCGGPTQERKHATCQLTAKECVYPTDPGVLFGTCD
jgi:hypothetical protein